MIGAWWVWALACAPAPLHLDAELVDGGVQVVANQPLTRVELSEAGGGPVAGRSLRRPSETVHLSAPILSGRTYHLTAMTQTERSELSVEAEDEGPVRVEIEAPAGQGRRLLRDGEQVAVARVGEAAVDVGLRLTAARPVRVVMQLDGEREAIGLSAAGAKHIARIRLTDDAPRHLSIEADGVERAATLRAEHRSLDEARAALQVGPVIFPADSAGWPDRARPSDRITLPAAWWSAGLQRLGLGWRPRHDQAPWAWQTVTLHNQDPEPLSVVLRAQVLDGGQPAPAFQGWVREARTDAITALLRIPGEGSARAVLPVFVDPSKLDEAQELERVIEVLPLGASEPLHRIARPLFVSRGSPWASSGFVVALAASALGYALLGLRGRRWLTARRTSELVTLSLFASLTFVVGAAFQAVGVGLATVLGPFAPLFTGIFEDALRACLLGTLVALVPKPGVVSLATVVGYLLRALALGSVHPVDLLYVGSAVFWFESWLWLSGCTRIEAWREGPRLQQWLRLGVGLGMANLCATATGLVVSVVFYRLYFAAWYVAMILALPGFLYVWLGSWIAVDFAAALRRVQA